MPLLYACVYDGSNIIGRSTSAETDTSVLVTTLKTALATVNVRKYRRQTIEDGPVNPRYHYLCSGNGKIVACASTVDTPTRVVFMFLDGVDTQLGGELRDVKKLLTDALAFYNDPANARIIQLRISWEEQIRPRHGSFDDVVRGRCTLGPQTDFNETTALMWRLRLGGIGVGAFLISVVFFVFLICKPSLSNC